MSLTVVAKKKKQLLSASGGRDSRVHVADVGMRVLDASFAVDSTSDARVNNNK